MAIRPIDKCSKVVAIIFLALMLIGAIKMLIVEDSSNLVVGLFISGVILWAIFFIVFEVPSVKAHPVKKCFNGHTHCPMYTTDVCPTIFGRPYRLKSLDYEVVRLYKVFVTKRKSVEIVAVTDKGLPVCYLSKCHRDKIMELLPYFHKAFITDFHTDLDGYDMGLTIHAYFLEEPTNKYITLADDYVEEYLKTDNYSVLDEIEAEREEAGDFGLEGKNETETEEDDDFGIDEVREVDKEEFGHKHGIKGSSTKTKIKDKDLHLGASDGVGRSKAKVYNRKDKAIRFSLDSEKERMRNSQ